MSDELPAVFMGVVCVLALLFAMLIGYGARLVSIADACKRMGVFDAYGIVYDCKPRTGGN
jgi:hypothetical protein